MVAFDLIFKQLRNVALEVKFNESPVLQKFAAKFRRTESELNLFYGRQDRDIKRAEKRVAQNSSTRGPRPGFEGFGFDHCLVNLLRGNFQNNFTRFEN